jgi:hypothetical protein
MLACVLACELVCVLVRVYVFFLNYAGVGGGGDRDD